ncbi:hypothetical protein D3C76_1401630 [compost metagenome]
MGADYRVNDLLYLRQLLGSQGRAPVAFEFGFSVTGGIGVSGTAALDHFAQGVRYSVPGFMHVGEQGVTAFTGQFLGMQHGTEAWQLFVRQVRVPEFAGITQADVLAIFDDVGNDQDLGVASQQELLEHMDL